jgi:hypothetical protein
MVNGKRNSKWESNGNTPLAWLCHNTIAESVSQQPVKRNRPTSDIKTARKAFTRLLDRRVSLRPGSGWGAVLAPPRCPWEIEARSSDVSKKACDFHAISTVGSGNKHREPSLYAPKALELRGFSDRQYGGRLSLD